MNQKFAKVQLVSRMRMLYFISNQSTVCVNNSHTIFMPIEIFLLLITSTDYRLKPPNSRYFEKRHHKMRKHGALSEPELREIFEAKSRDFGIKATDKLFARFLKHRGNTTRTKVLEMENSSLGPEAAEVLTRLVMIHRNFKILCFSGNSFGNNGALFFAELIQNTKTIVSVDLSSNLFTDTGMQAILKAMCENHSIVDLYLGSVSGLYRNKIGKNGILELAKLLENNRILSSLDLSMAEIRADNIQPMAKGLSRNHTLQMLNLTNNNIKSKGASLLIDACRSSHLEELHIACNHITDDVSSNFAKFLAENKTLTLLDISGNDLTIKFITAISLPLSSKDCFLQELDLSKNPIGEKGILPLAHAISTNTSLKKLNIAGCKIQAQGFVDFCDLLELNMNLVTLIAHHNPIRDEGATKMADVIRVHPTLKEIDLEVCEIGDPGSKELFSAAVVSSALEKISVKNNLINDGINIQRAIQANPKLRHVNIEFNDIEYKVYTEIQRTIQMNKKAKIRSKNHLSKEEQDILRANYDQELDNVRECIKLERNYIKEMKEEIVKTEEYEKDVQKSSEENISSLEEKLETVGNTVNDQIIDFRKDRSALEKKVEEIEINVNNLSARLTREIDNFKLDSKNLGKVTKKMEEFQERTKKELKDLEDLLKRAKDNYRDNRRMLESAFQFAKMGNNPEDNEGNKKSNKKGRKKKDKAEQEEANSNNETSREGGDVEQEGNEDEQEEKKETTIKESKEPSSTKRAKSTIAKSKGKPKSKSPPRSTKKAQGKAKTSLSGKPPSKKSTNVSAKEASRPSDNYISPQSTTRTSNASTKASDRPLEEAPADADNPEENNTKVSVSTAPVMTETGSQPEAQ